MFTCLFILLYIFKIIYKNGSYLQTLSTTSSHHSNGAQSDKLKLLYHHSFPAVFASLFVSFIYTAILWDQPNRDILLIWLAVLTLSSLLRLIVFIGYRRSKPDKNQVLKWERPYFITLVISSLIWGIGSVIVIMNHSFLYQTITYYFLMGMAGGAISVYAAVRYMVTTVIASIILPITIWFFFQNDTTMLLMAIAGCIFLVSAYRAVSIMSDTLHNSFMMTHQLTQANAKAERLARTDMLTGLNNRRAFTELAKQQLQYCQRNLEPVSMLVLDLDLFKHVNDIHGHAAGDHALKHLANVMIESIRASDVCGRTGGEEFAVMLPNTELNSAIEVAEKLRDAVASSPVHTPERSFPITTSIGVASGNYGLETLLQLADKAMYKAKQSGRNKVECIKPDQQ